MILSRTPLRVSFVGGGTDLPLFYEAHEYGCVISTAIDKYVYVGVNHRFDNRIRLAYSRNELVDSLDEVDNDRMQAAMRWLEIDRGIEIFYISDVPKGVGLGGSSSFTVGLLSALHAYKGHDVFPERLAREACQIEINVLNNPIGKQDQYAAALGGMNYIKFWANGTVSVKPILVDEELIRSITANLVFIYLGQSHEASDILQDVGDNIARNGKTLLALREITDALYVALINRDVTQFADALKESWMLKKATSSKVSNDHIDLLYDRCVKAGAVAGKVLGAGGGGFLMMYVPVEKHEAFFAIMNDIQVHRFDIDHSGARIVHSD